MIPIPNPNLPLQSQDLVVLLAMMAWGEFRSEAPETVLAGLCVPLNRTQPALWRPEYGPCDLRSILLHPSQFSCFGQNDPNYHKLLAPLISEGVIGAKAWEKCYTAAYVQSNSFKDYTARATFYFLKGEEPEWTKQLQQTGEWGGPPFGLRVSTFWRYPDIPLDITEDLLGG